MQSKAPEGQHALLCGSQNALTIRNIDVTADEGDDNHVSVQSADALPLLPALVHFLGKFFPTLLNNVGEPLCFDQMR